MRRELASSIRKILICGALRVGAILLAALFAMGVKPGLVAGQKSGKPASKNDIIGLLEAGVSSREVEDAVKQYGVSFELTRQTESELRSAGATDELIRAIRAAASRASTSPNHPPASNPPPAPSPPVLLIESTPGGAEVYVDDEPIGTTSSEGRLKLSTLAPGQHRVRLSLQGRRDFEQVVELKAGETATLPVTLEVAKVQAPPSPPTPQVRPGRRVRDSSPTPQEETPKPSLITFSVAHDHGAGTPQPNYCVGVLAVGSGIAHYRSTDGAHAFDFPASEVKEIKRNGVYLSALGAFHIRLRNNHVYNFVVINSNGQYQPPNQVLNALHQALGE